MLATTQRNFVCYIYFGKRDIYSVTMGTCLAASQSTVSLGGEDSTVYLSTTFMRRTVKE